MEDSSEHGALPSPDYVPGPEDPEQAPPSPVYLPYVPEPVYPEYMPPEDDVLPAEEQPLPAAASPTTESPGYIPESDLEEDIRKILRRIHPTILLTKETTGMMRIDQDPSDEETEPFETDESTATPPSPPHPTYRRGHTTPLLYHETEIPGFVYRFIRGPCSNCPTPRRLHENHTIGGQSESYRSLLPHDDQEDGNHVFLIGEPHLLYKMEGKPEILQSLGTDDGSTTKKMAPKRRTTRSTPVTDTPTTTSVTNAQLQAMIDQGVTAALAARDATKNAR
ncbi:hypothetical protein Tco_0509432 [Tanacetum coccineum]